MCTQVLVGPSIFIAVQAVDFLQHFETFDYLSEDRVAALKLIHILPSQGDEELRSVRILLSTGVRHANQSNLVYFATLDNLILEITCVAIQYPIYGVSSLASTSGITSLSNKILLNVVEQTVVVELDLAKFEEVFRRDRARFGE